MLCDKSSICAWVSARGVRNSWAAFPVNWRCAEKPSSSLLIMLLNDLLNCLNSGSTFSLISISARLFGCTFSIWAAKLQRGFNARPLTKYASTPSSCEFLRQAHLNEKVLLNNRLRRHPIRPPYPQLHSVPTR